MSREQELTEQRDALAFAIIHVDQVARRMFSDKERGADWFGRAELALKKALDDAVALATGVPQVPTP